MFVTETQTTSGPHRRERAVNRRVQGDLGEFSAMEWLASKGALVWIPLGHSPDVDLMAELNGRLVRIQVKTSTYKTETPAAISVGKLPSRRVVVHTVGRNRGIPRSCARGH